MNDLNFEISWTRVRLPPSPPSICEVLMKKTKKIDKTKHRKVKADDAYKDQLEDAWHLITKRDKLGRKELMIKVGTIEAPDPKNEH